MDIILYYIRDNIVSVHYFIYAFVCFFLMFALIGYLYKQKYAKVEIKLNSSQPKKEEKDLIKNINQMNKISAKQTSQPMQQVNNSQIFSNPVATNNLPNINNNQTINSPVTTKPMPNDVKQVTTPIPIPNQAPNIINPQPIPNPIPQKISNQPLQTGQKTDLK